MTNFHALYLCRVRHARFRPFKHAFAYRVWSVLLDLDHLDRLPALLSHNRPNLFSFQDRDHGARDGSPLKPWVLAMLADAGIDLPGATIRLLCFPRLAGYVFNPLSVYYCHGADGDLRAILYEVKNTFGDQHCYVCPVTADEATAGIADHHHAKEFHVSPFLAIAGDYAFRLTVPGERLTLQIRHSDGEGDLLLATQTGHRRPLTAMRLLALLATHPLVTLKVTLGIHWEALRLWIKGARFHRRPEPPPSRLSKQTMVHR